jgi:acyl carrier protein
MAMNWDLWQQAHPMAHKIPRFSQLIQEELSSPSSANGTGEENSLLQELILLEPDARQARIESHLRDLFAGIMRIDPARLDINQSSSSLGMDSIMAVELNSRIEVGFGIKLSMVELLQGPSVVQLAENIAANLQFDDDLDALLDEIENLSTDEVMALLSES